MRRVVVTGMGIITALGCGINDNWKKLISATSGISLIDSFKTDDLSSRVGGVIQDEIIDNNFSEKDKRKMDKFILYSLIATEEAIKNSFTQKKISFNNHLNWFKKRILLIKQLHTSRIIMTVC